MSEIQTMFTEAPLVSMLSMIGRIINNAKDRNQVISMSISFGIRARSNVYTISVYGR
jgi:hypothetical protein